MNLNTIAIAPHATGFIKVACENDPLFGEKRTINEFLITARHHGDDENRATLAMHPLHATLAKPVDGGDAKAVTEIPITLFFNKTSNALGIKYQAYSTEGNVPVCAGDGRNAKRLARAADNTPTLQDVACPGPELCALVQTGAAVCRRQVRMSVQIKGQGDPLSVFEVRSSSLNTYRALKAQLQLVEHRFAGLRHVPLKLTLWQASNVASGYQPFTLMQLALDAPDEITAMQAVKAERERLTSAGINDSIDDILSTDSDAVEFVGATLDFGAVSEFYSADAARRPGTEAITPHSTGRSARANLANRELAGAAASAFADAVRPASATSPEAAPAAAET